MASRAIGENVLYFGYGSNLWLDQMHRRCPGSPYVGVARLPGYRWIINSRGYANVVSVSTSSTQQTEPISKAINADADNPAINKQNEVNTDTDTNPDPCTQVYGLAYDLTPTDEERLDINEGVPESYTKEVMTVDLWLSSSSSSSFPSSLSPPKTQKALIYIDRTRTAESKPKEEYIYRMNRGIDDALRLGVPKEYVDVCLRRFIPSDHDDEEEEEDDGGRATKNEKAKARKQIRDLAVRQAGQFLDEADP